MKSTAFLINGGAGRVLCSIPALEKYEQENPDDDFIVVADSAYDIFAGHPTLDQRAYPFNHKNLFKDKIKDRVAYSPEPYNIFEYYNQQCNISQAFDIAISNNGVRDLARPTIRLSNMERYGAKETIAKIKKDHGNKKVAIFQPFGRGANLTPGMITPDSYGKSFSIEDTVKIVNLLNKEYIVILMTESPIDLRQCGCDKITPTMEGLSLRQWFALINEADYFLGCDSVGQHAAHAFNKKATVVLGSTYKENVSYPNDSNFTIIDNGGERRFYSPIRISYDDTIDRANENLMVLTNEQLDIITQSVKEAI